MRGSLTKNKTIKVLKQDKDGGVVIMDSSKYTEKSLGILEKKQFARINDDPTFSSYNAVETKFKFFYQNVFILLSGIPFLNCYASKDQIVSNKICLRKDLFQLPATISFLATPISPNFLIYSMLLCCFNPFQRALAWFQQPVKHHEIHRHRHHCCQIRNQEIICKDFPYEKSLQVGFSANV